MTNACTLLALSGRLRARSSNTDTLRAAEMLAPEWATVTLYSALAELRTSSLISTAGWSERRMVESASCGKRGGTSTELDKRGPTRSRCLSPRSRRDVSFSDSSGATTMRV